MTSSCRYDVIRVLLGRFCLICHVRDASRHRQWRYDVSIWSLDRDVFMVCKNMAGMASGFIEQRLNDQACIRELSDLSVGIDIDGRTIFMQPVGYNIFETKNRNASNAVSYCFTP